MLFSDLSVHLRVLVGAVTVRPFACAGRCRDGSEKEECMRYHRALQSTNHNMLVVV